MKQPLRKPLRKARTSVQIISIEPATGVSTGGETVRINMTRVRAVPVITFDGSPATVVDAVYGPLGHVDVLTPAGVAGAVDVLVEDYHGTTPAGVFTYSGAAPLEPGVVTAIIGDNTVTLTATPATNGVQPYTYQYYRSTDGSLGSILPGATTRNWEDDTALNDIEYTYTLRVTDAEDNFEDYDPVTVTPGVSEFPTFIAITFDEGTTIGAERYDIMPATGFYGGNFTIIPDPTGELGGNVCAIDFTHPGDCVTSADINRHLQYTAPIPDDFAGFNKEIWFYCELVMDDPTASTAAQAFRKIVRFDSTNGQNNLILQQYPVGGSYKSLRIETSGGSLSNPSNIIVHSAQDCFEWNEKLTVKIQIIINSAADQFNGVLRAWYNDVLKIDRNDLRLYDSARGGPYKLCRPGAQTQSTSRCHAYTENRYFKNIRLSATPIVDVTLPRPNPTGSSVAIPVDAIQWEVDPTTTYQTHEGWGVIPQIGQETPAVHNDDPSYADEIAAELVDLNITWMTKETYAGTLRSDGDYWQTYYNAGSPSSGPERSAFTAHRFWPVNSAYFFSRESHYMTFAAKLKAAVEAAGKDFKWYAKISQYDTAVANNVGGFILSDFPDRYALMIKALWDFYATSPLGIPDGLDVMNETQYNNNWNTAEVAEAIAQTHAVLTSAGYPEPLWFAPSYQAPGLLTASNADLLWNKDSGAYRTNLRFGTHMYGASGAYGQTSLTLLADTTATRGGRWWNMESPQKPLSSVMQLLHGCSAQMNFAAASNAEAATGIDPYNTLLGYFPSRQSGYQVGLLPNARFLKRIYKAINVGDIRVEATPSNLVMATHEAACAAYKDPSTGWIKGVATSNKNNQPLYVQVPAGVYRVRATVGTYTTATGISGTPTLVYEDTRGILYTVAAGEGIYLNEQHNDQGGVYSFERVS